MEMLTLFGLVITVLGLVVTVVAFHYRSGRPQLLYCQTSRLYPDRLGRDLPADLVERHRGQTIPPYCRTRLVLWNGGRKPVLREKVRKPITVSFSPGAKIGKAEILRRTSDDTETTITVVHDTAGDRLVCDFDYLDQDDGVSMEVWHSGAVDDVRCACGVLGMKAGVQRRDHPEWLGRHVSNTDFLFLTILAFGFCALGFLISLGLEAGMARLAKAIALVAAAAAVGTVVFFWAVWRRIPKGLALPDGD